MHAWKVGWLGGNACLVIWWATTILHCKFGLFVILNIQKLSLNSSPIVYLMSTVDGQNWKGFCSLTAITHHHPQIALKMLRNCGLGIVSTHLFPAILVNDRRKLLICQHRWISNGEALMFIISILSIFDLLHRSGLARGLLWVAALPSSPTRQTG